jgi:hypothetical protein
MTGEQLFALWAPGESPWSVWAKPVLFATLNSVPDTTIPLTLPDIANFPEPSGTAVVIDVVGTDSVLYGLSLAKIGYRPVPLYNGAVAPNAIINMGAIQTHLGYGAPILEGCAIGPSAPPVFLLNAERLDDAYGADIPGRFDNRWCVVLQDMPSIDALRDSGIKQVVLIANGVMDDLSHILCRYQDGGLPILRTPDFGTAPDPQKITRPKFYKSLVERFEVYAGLRRNAAGGFGAVVPDSNSGGGFG